jgi:hypothetical protein
MLARLLIAAAAVIMLSLGTAHLVFTFHGSKLRPRDPALEARMRAVSPGISSQTTMWRAWVGFNASHSFGAMLFGTVYGHLALAEPAALFGSGFLAAVGGVLLLGYVILAQRYWFRAPLRGVLAASGCYAAGFAAAWA